MSEYPTVPLREVCESVEYGYTASATTEPVGPRFLRITDIVPERLDWNSVPFCKIEPKTLSRHRLRTGDIVIARTGATTGWAKFIKDPPEAVFASYLVRVRPSAAVDGRFVGFVVESPAYKNFIQQHMGGAAQPNANAQVLTSYRIPLPPLPVQRLIAGVLSAYDDQIENGRRRIQILEAMARALYREWFVEFRFPGGTRLPRVASPLGDIPQGWEVANLDTVKAQQPYAINGGPFGSKLCTRDYVAEGIPVIRGSNLCESGRFDASDFVFVSSEKAAELHPNLAKHGDIIITQRGTLGQIGMIPSGTGYDRFVVSQSQMKITTNPTKVNREYVFFFLRSKEANRRIKNLASSSGVPHINLAVLREFMILLPPFELQTKFGMFALSTEAAVEALMRQIENLCRTRDLLLPRLLSGQVALTDTAA